MIAGVALVRLGNKIVAVRDHKGRGTILPGGKHEKDETFRQAALRELEEETHLVAVKSRFVCVIPDENGTPCFVFECYIQEDSIWDHVGVDYGSGEVVLATWDDLAQSDYRGFYDVLREHMTGF